jgi:hypothetical protein
MSAIYCQQALRVPTVVDSQISVPPVRKPTISSISQSFYEGELVREMV